MRSTERVDPAAHQRVKERAFRLLARREHSVKELAAKLARGEDAGESLIRAVVEELAANDHVSDLRYAHAFARDAVNLRPRARKRIVSELVAKGVPARTAAGAVEAVFMEAGVDDPEIARRVARSYLPRVAGRANEAQWRRLAGFLQRRGFDNALIYDICIEFLPDPG